MTVMKHADENHLSGRPYFSGHHFGKSRKIMEARIMEEHYVLAHSLLVPGSRLTRIFIVLDHTRNIADRGQLGLPILINNQDNPFRCAYRGT